MLKLKIEYNFFIIVFKNHFDLSTFQVAAGIMGPLLTPIVIMIILGATSRRVGHKVGLCPEETWWRHQIMALYIKW